MHWSNRTNVILSVIRTDLDIRRGTCAIVIFARVCDIRRGTCAIVDWSFPRVCDIRRGTCAIVSLLWCPLPRWAFSALTVFRDALTRTPTLNVTTAKPTLYTFEKNNLKTFCKLNLSCTKYFAESKIILILQFCNIRFDDNQMSENNAINQLSRVGFKSQNIDTQNDKTKNRRRKKLKWKPIKMEILYNKKCKHHQE